MTRKKKIVVISAITAFSILLVLFLSPVVYALFRGDTPPASEMNLHTATTHTSFNITEEGYGRVYVDYLGYESAVKALIRVRIEGNGKTVVDEEYVMEGNQGDQTYEYPLYDVGVYHCEVIYTVIGSNGEQDVIPFEQSAECKTAAARPIVTTEELLYGEDGLVKERILIEYDGEGNRVLDTVYDRDGNTVAEIRYHTDSPFPKDYYQLGEIEALKNGDLPFSVASFTVWTEKPAVSGTQQYGASGEITVTLSLADGVLLLSEMREYDETLRLSAVTAFDETGALVDVSRYEYRKDGKSLLTREFYTDGVPGKRAEYDEDGNLTRELLYTDGELSAESTYYRSGGVREAYLREGDRAWRTEYTTSGESLYVTEISFDEHGRPIEETKRNRSGRMVARRLYAEDGRVEYYEFDYDGSAKLVEITGADGAVISRATYGADVGSFDHKTYIYDENGRVVEEIRKNIGSLMSGYLENGALRTFDPSYKPSSPPVFSGTSLPQSVLFEITAIMTPLMTTSTKKYTYLDNGNIETVTYDQKQRVLMKGLYEYEGELLMRYTSVDAQDVTQEANYVYREDGTLLEERIVNHYDDELTTTTIRSYREDGQISEILYEYSGEKEIYTYDTDGILQEVVMLRADGSAKRRSIYEDGLLKEETTLAQDGTVENRTTYRDGIPMRYEQTVDPLLKIEKELTITYMYDENGFLVEKIINYHDGKGFSTIHYEYSAQEMLTEKWARFDHVDAYCHYGEYGIPESDQIVQRTPREDWSASCIYDFSDPQ